MEHLKRLSPEEEQKILLILKLDAQHLMERLKERKNEYLGIFGLKRSREHFKDIFESRYFDIGAVDLLCCGQETIIALDNFYSEVEKLHWYYKSTEDLPQMVLDHTNKEILKISEAYKTLDLYLNADLGLAQEEVDSERSSTSTGETKAKEIIPVGEDLDS